MTKLIYRTSWFFVEHTNLDKTIYSILENYLKQGRYSRYQELWAKYFALCYLGGYRRVEPFLSKVVISSEEDNRTMYYHLVKPNAKHFKNGERERIQLLFTPANAYEAAMWEFLAPHQREIIDFSPLLGGPLNKETLAEVSKKFSMRFRAKITNGQIVEENGGVTPHMLRHARTYDLHIIEGYPDYMVMKIMGWNRREMVDWYEDIKAALNIQEFKQIYVKKKEEWASAPPQRGVFDSIYLFESTF